jgi:hypothetical protein
MHASSLENMRKCYERHIAGDFMAVRNKIIVLDIGGADINGSYRDIFSHTKFHYLAADLQPSEGVAFILNDPYNLPLADNSIDIVVSGQAFEHTEFFWLSFREMVRVLKPDGFIFLIAPSAGPIHNYPVDCYRFYPDSYTALAKYANCYLETVWLDERGPWNDLVGVFRKHYPVKIQEETSSQNTTSFPQSSFKPAPIWLSPGSAEAEITKGKQHYLSILARLHQVLKPNLYLEIGIRKGNSLRLAQRKAIGIDPEFDIEKELSEQFELFRETSDTFFDNHARAVLDRSIDFAFIDGMHRFEFALRDFMNIERYAHSATVVVIDDIFPNHPLQASRERKTQVWTGDVWKLCICLKAYRPDLTLIALDTSPTGLLLIVGLDPKNRVLWSQYNPIVRHYTSDDYAVPPTSVLERQGAVPPDAPELWQKLRRLPQSNQQADNVREIIREISGQPPHKSSSTEKAMIQKCWQKPMLSLVVIGYNMRRELPRTILSLSPEMQKGIEADDYEIILIDNGSTEPVNLEVCHSWNAPLHYVEMSNPTVSPVPAINRGLELARGEVCGVMIDGARIASPGIIFRAIQASRLHHRPVISTLGFHLGSEVQMSSVHKGYNQEKEDRLLEQANWAVDGYRLFEISVFAGSSASGWFKPIAESNALFMPRELWHELGGYEEQFVSPGGGLANLDTYARACALPDSQLIILLGEGTFHQVHGGVATNALEPKIQEFQAEYQKIRGYPFQIPQVNPLYLGQIAHQVFPSMAQSIQAILQGQS